MTSREDVDDEEHIVNLLVIEESSVLLRIEHLEQSACGVAVVATTDLVDLVNKD